MTTKIVPLPDDHHVVRHVTWTRLLRDADDNVVGFLPEAFQLRTDASTASGLEESLSVNWLEFFADSANRTRDCVWSMRKSRAVSRKSAFAIGNVGKIKEICAGRGYKVRIVHEPTDDEPAHAAIRRLPREDLTLLLALAEEAFTTMVQNRDIAEEP